MRTLPFARARLPVALKEDHHLLKTVQNTDDYIRCRDAASADLAVELCLCDRWKRDSNTN